MPAALPLIASYVASYLGYSAAVQTAVAIATSAAVAAAQQRSGRLQRSRQSRDAAAAAYRSRTVMIRSGVAPRKIALGTVRLSGPMMYAEFAGDQEEYFDSIVALTHGEIHELVGIYLDDEYIAASSITSQQPTTGKYSVAEKPAERRMEAHVLVASATITLDYAPDSSADVQAVVQSGGGENITQEGVEISSVVGAVVTLAVPLTGEVWVSYSTHASLNPPIKLQWAMGSDGQASTTWSGVSTPKWTADHKLGGVSHVRALMRIEDNVFAAGSPNISAVVRGPKSVYDPRTLGYVAGTSNPALLAAWYRTLPRVDGGLGVPSDWVDWDSVATAANICDELISVKKLDGTGYENVKRYECHTVLSLDQPPLQNLQVILDSMAGDFPFTGGLYRCFAGAFRTAMLTITDADVVAGSPIVLSPMMGGDQAVPNTIAATFYDAAHGWVETAARSVVNSAYVSSDGGTENMELDLSATTDERQANYLMGVHLERSRPALAISLTLGGVGANMALLDTVQFALEGYSAIAGKTFEVRRRTNEFNGRYPVELREVKSTTYALEADRFTPATPVTPVDNSALFSPAPVAITSVVASVMQQGDGTLITRAKVSWSAHPQSFVRDAGTIEVRWRRPDAEWVTAAPVPGSQTYAYIGPLERGSVVFIEARARNGLGAVSEWTGTTPFTVPADTTPPADVTGLACEIKPSQAVISWDPCPDSDYAATELRVAASWAAGTADWVGAASEFKMARPANGTYTLWAAHLDASGNYSPTPASIVVVVDDSMDPGTGERGSIRAYSDSVSPPIYSVAPWNGVTDDNLAAKVVWQMLGLGTWVDGTTSHLRIGDEVTLKNSGGTAVATRAWGGTGWLNPSIIIDGSAIITGTVAADKLNINSSIAIAAGGSLRSGQTAYDTGTGFWLGTVSATPKFSIGNTSKSLLWDGSALTVRGQLIGSGNLQAGTVGATNFASGIEPVTIVSAVPGTKSTNSIFNTTDAKLYRWNGSAYVATVPTTDLTGTISTAQIADGSVSGTKFASSIEPITIVSAVPGSKSTNTIFDTTTDKLYRWNGAAYVATVPTTDLTGTVSDAQIAGMAASKVTGQLSDSQIAALAAAKLTGTISAAQIADGSVSGTKFASGIEPVTIVSAVPGTKSTCAIFNTTDSKLYRWNGAAYVATLPTTDLSGTVSDAQIAGMAAAKLAGSITTTQITDSAISTAKLSAGAVTAAKITAGAITSAEIAAGTITAANIATDTITAGQIAAGAIGASEIAAGAVTAGKIAALSITAGDIAAAAITTAKIAASAVTAGEIAALSISTAHLAAGAVTAAKITAGTITSAEIAAGTITAANIATDTITAGQIAAGAIGASEIAAGAVTAGKIAALSIAAGDIAAATITGAKIAAGTITAANIAADTITAGEIAAGAIGVAELAAGAVTAAKIAAGTITATELSATAINSMTVTGATLQTATSAARVMMNNAGMYVYNSSGVVVGLFGPASTTAVLTVDIGAAVYLGIEARSSGNNTSIYANNTNNGFGIQAASSSGIGVSASTTSGVALVATRGTNVAKLATSTEAVNATGGLPIKTDNQLVSTVATGTPPLAVTSTTKVSNLNADLVDGLHFDTSITTTGGTTVSWDMTKKPGANTTQQGWLGILMPDGTIWCVQAFKKD